MFEEPEELREIVREDLLRGAKGRADKIWALTPSRPDRPPPVSNQARGNPAADAGSHLHPSPPSLEAIMPATKRPPLVILGWQSWSILAVVLVMVIAAAVWIMLG